MAFKRLKYLKKTEMQKISVENKTAATLHFVIFHQRFCGILLKRQYGRRRGRTHAAWDGYGVGGAFLCGR